MFKLILITLAVGAGMNNTPALQTTVLTVPTLKLCSEAQANLTFTTKDNMATLVNRATCVRAEADDQARGEGSR